jgi:hypothetical protein
LYADERLSAKFSIFQKVTLPSLQGNTWTDWTWHILAGVHLPRKWKDELESLIEGDDRISVHYVENMEKAMEYVDRVCELAKTQGKPFASFRIDDDDGLHRDYMKDLIHSFSHESPDTIVYPATGQQVQISDTDNEKLVYGPYLRFNAFPPSVGVGCIQCNIHSKGPHDTLRKGFGEQVKVFTHPSAAPDQPLIYKSTHEFNDSGGGMSGAAQPQPEATPSKQRKKQPRNRNAPEKLFDFLFSIFGFFLLMAIGVIFLCITAANKADKDIVKQTEERRKAEKKAFFDSL